MMSSSNAGGHLRSPESGTAPKPDLDARRIGIVSRDYRVRYPNGRRDFTHAMPETLRLLDSMGCDTALFSLFSVPAGYDPAAALRPLENLRTVLIEEFMDGTTRKEVKYCVYYRSSQGWQAYSFCQKFASAGKAGVKTVNEFVASEVPRRVMGKVGVLLCGESNGVRYSKADKGIHDSHGMRAAISQGVEVILNPIHDRMTRFEMPLKRKFLSEQGRWVISVWNKGKETASGKTRDGQGPAWTVFHDGVAVEVPRIPNELGVEIGVLHVS